MFGFLKDKLKGAISKFSKSVEEESKEEFTPVEDKPKKETKKSEEKKEVKHKEVKKKDHKVKEKTKKVVEEKKLEVVEEEIKIENKDVKESVEVKEEKSFFSKLKDKFTIKEESKEEFKHVEKQEIKEEKSFFDSIKEKITTTKISNDKFEELFSELEIGLLESNVALEVIDKIKDDLKTNIVDKPIKRGSVEDEIKNGLKSSIEDLFLVPNINLIDNIKNKSPKPYVICFVGINGSGKTTSISKIANMLKQNKLSVVLAASDTFRAAAIQQLKEWGEKLNLKVIAHDYGSDPAAVAFDAISYAKAHNIDVVLIDTAGRLHSNKDLVREMEKIVRVSKPDLKLFVGESITGNDCTEQCKEFNSAINIDGIILSKADIDEKGGTMVSVSYITKKPILYLGTGQSVNDIKEFNKDEIIKNLGL
ncbi:MAG: signal recognition particle-docking protein FtsY [Nanoarchaeota archaeon]